MGQFKCILMPVSTIITILFMIFISDGIWLLSLSTFYGGWALLNYFLLGWKQEAGQYFNLPNIIGGKFFCFFFSRFHQFVPLLSKKTVILPQWTKLMLPKLIDLNPCGNCFLKNRKIPDKIIFTGQKRSLEFCEERDILFQKWLI